MRILLKAYKIGLLDLNQILLSELITQGILLRDAMSCCRFANECLGSWPVDKRRT